MLLNPRDYKMLLNPKQLYTFTDIFFLNEQYGFVTAGGYNKKGGLFFTNDGGETWKNLIILSEMEDYRFYGVYFTDINHGFVCGEYGEDDEGILLKTVDGGYSWDAITSQCINSGLPKFVGTYTQVVFLDNLHGFLISAGEYFLESFDGGKTWQKVEIIKGQPYGIYFLDEDPNYGWLLCQELDFERWESKWTGHMVTLDGGKNWFNNDDIFEDRKSIDVSACRFWNTKDGIICGPDGALYRTYNGGKFWNKLNSPSNKDLNFLFIPSFDKNIIWMVGEEGNAWFSYNGGISWRKVESGTEKELHGIWFISPKIGFIIGEEGTFLKTQDGGFTWNEINLFSS